MIIKMRKIIILISVVLFGACDYLDVDPIGQVIPHTVSDYRALLTSAYKIQNQKDKLMYPSDEVVDIDKLNNRYTSNIMNVTWKAESSVATEYGYIEYYKIIFYANEVIARVMTADVDSSGESREQIFAEAHALRAYCYFDLINMYAKWYDPATAATDPGVPLTTDIDVKQEFPRSSVEAVYAQILSDMKVAGENMKVDVQPQKYNYRFSKRSLAAIEARIRLYRGEWDEAFSLAKSVIDQASAGVFELTDMTTNDFARPFAPEASEAILAIEKPFISLLADQEETYIGASIGDLFVDGDSRKNKYCKIFGRFIMHSEPRYYRVEYYSNPKPGQYEGKRNVRVSSRLSEMYLIAAEAAAKKSSPSISEAKFYLNELQKRRFTIVPDLSTMSLDETIEEIADERARELLMEGHRWFDLRRTTRPVLEKEIVTSYFMDWEAWEETIKFETYKLNSYILPFPRSAKESNPYLN